VRWVVKCSQTGRARRQQRGLLISRDRSSEP
jgi:hypothetical protein